MYDKSGLIKLARAQGVDSMGEYTSGAFAASRRRRRHGSFLLLSWHTSPRWSRHSLLI